jgi:hypothetical protein
VWFVTIQPEALVIRADNLPFSKVDDAVIAMSREMGFCYAINSTGTRIWELIAEPVRVLSLCDSLCREFDVDRDTCLTDVISVLTEMKANGLIRELA